MDEGPTESKSPVAPASAFQGAAAVAQPHGPATVLESLLSLQRPADAARWGPLLIHPVVLDSCVVVQDVARSVRTGESTVLQEAMQLGPVRPYASHRTYAEILRTFHEDEAGLRVDATAAEELYWKRYAPFLRFVDVAVTRKAERALGQRDPSDQGTAALVELLAPVASFSTDRDLTDIDLAVSHWVRPVAAAWQGGVLDLLAGLGGLGVRSLVTKLSPWRPVVRREAPLVGALLALLAAGVVAHPTGRTWLGQGAARTGHLLATSAQGLAGLVGMRALTIGEVADAHRGEANPSTLGTVGRGLALAPLPLTPIELARTLRDDQLDGIGVRACLEHHACFVEDSEGRWQLGKTMQGFGGALAQPPAQKPQR